MYRTSPARYQLANNLRVSLALSITRRLGRNHWAIQLLEERLLYFLQSSKCPQKHGGFDAISMTTGFLLLMVITTDQPRSWAFNKSILPPGFLRKFFKNIHCVLWCSFCDSFDIFLTFYLLKKKKTMAFCFTYCHFIVYIVKKGCFSHWKSDGKIHDFFYFS